MVVFALADHRWRPGGVAGSSDRALLVELGQREAELGAAVLARGRPDATAHRGDRGVRTRTGRSRRPSPRRPCRASGRTARTGGSSPRPGSPGRRRGRGRGPRRRRASADDRHGRAGAAVLGRVRQQVADDLLDVGRVGRDRRQRRRDVEHERHARPARLLRLDDARARVAGAGPAPSRSRRPPRRSG